MSNDTSRPYEYDEEEAVGEDVARCENSSCSGSSSVGGISSSGSGTNSGEDNTSSNNTDQRVLMAQRPMRIVRNVVAGCLLVGAIIVSVTLYLVAWKNDFARFRTEVS
jgi:hypothetical protein